MTELQEKALQRYSAISWIAGIVQALKRDDKTINFTAINAKFLTTVLDTEQDFLLEIINPKKEEKNDRV